jgi:uncharacterized membrane protein
MLVAAFIFGLIILSISLFFLIFYVRSYKAMRENRNALARQRERQLRVQLDLQARMDIEARQFEETRRALLNQVGATPRTDKT